MKDSKMNLNDYNQETQQSILAYAKENNIKLEEILDTKEFLFVPNIPDYEAWGRYLMCELLDSLLNVYEFLFPRIENYFDFAAYGKDRAKEFNGHLINGGYLEIVDKKIAGDN